MFKKPATLDAFDRFGIESRIFELVCIIVRTAIITRSSEIAIKIAGDNVGTINAEGNVFAPTSEVRTIFVSRQLGWARLAILVDDFCGLRTADRSCLV